ncbi:unnamed protein product [Aspergillus oryzae var. brunneus]|uniref:Unnamed protein product n=2 Tax=Aspergillus oryzae TaxID=5062 RepID=A0AAN4YH63_ASPOZ|nr:unnamed protein product [Aspergillus oryzae]GMG29841.1 unnamed protein product [Aspergillus oryzae]GMG48295.1 unnamed protein product [Aspergillus oryzae var. brunneus]
MSLSALFENTQANPQDQRAHPPREGIEAAHRLAGAGPGVPHTPGVEHADAAAVAPARREPWAAQPPAVGAAAGAHAGREPEIAQPPAAAAGHLVDVYAPEGTDAGPVWFYVLVFLPGLPEQPGCWTRTQAKMQRV